MRIYITFLLGIGLSYSCNIAHKTVSEQPEFDFDNWKSSIFLCFNKMLEEDSIANTQQRINRQVIINEIDIINKKLFEYNFEKAIDENKARKWSHVYILYHFLEGEFNLSLSSFVFLNEKQYWGTTYDHNNGIYYRVNKQFAAVIDNVKPKIYGGGNGLAILTKFNNEMKNIKTVIVAGVSYSEELEPLMRIYDDKIFD